MFDMGGMPVDRSKPGGYVRSVIRAFEDADEMALVIAPEGTRSSTGKWRSGFYHIACGANVPIFENVASLDRLPDTGAFVAALPMKIAGGSGGPLRIVARVP